MNNYFSFIIYIDYLDWHLELYHQIQQQFRSYLYPIKNSLNKQIELLLMVEDNPQV